MPVQALTRDQPFYTVIPTRSPFTTRLGYGGHILDLTLGGGGGRHVGKQWAPDSIPGGGIYFHFEFFAYFPMLGEAYINENKHDIHPE